MDEYEDIDIEEAVDFCIDGKVVLSIDSEGIVYMGKRVTDAGEAYKAWMDTTRQMVAAQKKPK